MGTLLYSRGVPQRASLDQLVELRPDLIGAIHREYIEAGADAIEIPDPVTVRVLEGAGIDLVDDAALPPQVRIAHLAATVTRGACRSAG